MISAQCSCGHSCKAGKWKQQKCCRHHGGCDHVNPPGLAPCAWHHCSTTASRLPWQLATLLSHLPCQGQLPLQKASHCCPWLGCSRIFFSFWKLTSLGSVVSPEIKLSVLLSWELGQEIFTSWSPKKTSSLETTFMELWKQGEASWELRRGLDPSIR